MTKTLKSCHTGPTILLKTKGLELAGASRFEAEKAFYDFDLVISLDTINPDRTPIIKGDVKSIELVKLIEKYSPKTEHIKLLWPDMDIPYFDKDFWVDLANYLKKKGRDRERSGSSYKVMIHCMGGHGRTGTALCILASLCTNEGWQDSDLMEKVRGLYCTHAVESLKQKKYIEKIVGFKIEGNGFKEFSSVIYNSNNGYGIAKCLESEDKIKWHNKDIADKGKCVLCQSSVPIEKVEDNVKQIDIPSSMINSDNNRINSFIPITESEKSIRKRVRDELWNGKECIKHKVMICRNCSNEIVRRVELEKIIAKENRDKELEDRVKKFMAVVDDKMYWCSMCGDNPTHDTIDCKNNVY